MDKAATAAMLAGLKDGVEPLGPGDVFYHPQHGPMTVSRSLGWKDAMHFTPKNELKGIRVLAVTAKRQGKAKAERINFMLPAPAAKKGA